MRKNLLICLSMLVTVWFCGRVRAESVPNVLFIIADDWGAHAGAYGTKWVKTPAFDRVAREGLLFQQAFTPTAKCAPSRATILTGRYPWQLEEAGNHMAFFPAKFKSWPETLVSQGWTVGITGKGWGPGVANDIDGKPRQLAGKPIAKHTLKPPTTGIGNNDYAQNFSEFLDTKPSDRPWCFWCGFVEPHRAYEYQSGVQKNGKKLSDIDRVPSYWPDDEIVRNDMLDYAAEVEYLDAHVERMLADLDRRGLTENTVVIVTSDHGMPFPRCKGYAYYDSNHVPLAIRWPKGISSPGRTIEDHVSFVDIAATILDLATIAPAQSGMAHIVGRSWRSILTSSAAGQVDPLRDYTLVGKERTDVGRPNDWGYPIRGILRDRFLYLKNFEPMRWPAGNPETGYLDTDGSPTKSHLLELGRQNRANPFWQLNFGMRPREELYYLATDPDCIRNVANDPNYKEQKIKMETQLLVQLTSQLDPRMFGKGRVFDEYKPTAGEGFYDQWKRGEPVKAGWVQPSDFEKEPIQAGDAKR